MEAQRSVYAMRPHRTVVCPSTNPLRRRVFALTSSTAFELVIILFVLVNAAVMMLEWCGARERESARRARGLRAPASRQASQSAPSRAELNGRVPPAELLARPSRSHSPHLPL
jgi:hypothetical protein